MPNRYSGLFAYEEPSRYSGLADLAAPEPKKGSLRSRYAGMFALAEPEVGPRVAARERIAAAKAGGEEQAARIEASRKAEERRLFTPAGMAKTAGDLARNFGKGAVRSAESVGELLGGAMQATGAALQQPTRVDDPTLAARGMVGASAPGASVPWREEPNAGAGEVVPASPVAQAVGGRLRELGEEGARKIGPQDRHFAAREPGYIPEDFWEGMKTDPFKTLVINGVENIGPLAATLGAAAVAGPAAGLPAAFAMETGGAFNEAKEAGATDEQALQAAGMTGVANAALEYLPAGRLLGKIAKGAPKKELTGFVRDAVTQAATEGVTESMQETNNILASMATYAEDQKLDWEAVKRIGAAGMIGAVLGGGVGAGAAAVSSRRLASRYAGMVELVEPEATPPPAASSPPPQAGGGVVPFRRRVAQAIDPTVRQDEERRQVAEREADTDALTGLANRRALDRALPAAEADADTAVVVFDANDFGKLNKDAGHEAGDKAIVRMADAVRRAAQEQGVGERVFRRGGDEIVALVPVETAEAVRDRAEHIFGRIGGEGYAVTLSGTVAPTFAEADSALQGRKAERKAEPPPAQPESAQEAAPRVEAPATSQGLPAQPQAPPQPKTIPPERQGLEGRAFTATGTEVPFRWAVVDAAELVPSHDTLLRPSAAFPPELQPRQRNRAASREQIDSIAQNLEPERLGESPSAAEGAPIVGDDMVVESGNARTIAVTTAYERGKGEAYRKMIEERADRYGIAPEALEGIERPVLVRVRQGQADRARLAQEMNEPAVASMSATEKAQVDASRLTPAMLDGLRPSDSGEFTAANSGDFIRTFQQKVVPQPERGGMVDEKGQLSQQGKQRIRNAVFAAAYGDPEVSARLMEAEDSSIKSLGQALFREAPRMAKLRESMKAGDRNADLDIVPDVMAAARKLDGLRQEGTKVEEYLAQGELLGPELTPEARAVLETVGGPLGRSAKKMAGVLQRYQELVDAAGNPKQARLVEAGTRPTRLDLWNEAVETYEKAGQVDLFLPPPVRDFTAQAGFVGKKPGSAQPASPNAFSRPEVEAGFQRGRRGKPQESIKDRIAEAVTRARHAFSRELHRIPSGAKHAPFREAMRKVRTYDPTEEVSRQLGNAIAPLNDQQYDLFLRKTLLDDLAVIAETYEPGTKLPFEVTPDDLAADKPRIDAAAEADPHVKQAVEKVREVWTKAREDYRDAAATIGMDTSFLDRRGEAYLHHQVVEHALAEGARQGRKVQAPKKKGFQKKLRGSVGDINLNYGEAQGQVLVQLALDANMARQVAVIGEKYDISADLKAQAKEASKGGAMVRWESLIPGTHLPWQPDEGSVFYMGKTITDRIAQRLLADPSVSITPEDIRNALVIGGKKKTMVLPKEIVETLNEIGKQRASDLESTIWRGNRRIVGLWKKVMLLMPRRVFKYATRNFLGDTQKTLMGNPAAVKRFKSAASDLADYTYGKSDPSPELTAWLARGGWSSGLFQQELETSEKGRRQRLRAATEMAGLLEQVKDAKTLVPKYFMKVGRHVSFLEAVNRYANFLEYRAQMEANPEGRPNNFGASRAEEVMGMEDVNDRAYWLSNQLIGAYDQISEAGQFLRRHFIPFWSFQELNMRSHWALYRNAATAPESALKRARKAGVITAKMAPAAAYRVAKLFGLMMTFEAFMHAWNYGFFEDEEDDLPEDIRRTPHIILGRNEDSTVRYFNRLSVFAEAREWFGVDEFGYSIGDYLDGRISGKQLLEEVAKVPGNKLLNSIGPVSGGGVKLAFELATGKTTFPQPRDIHDRLDYAFRTIGMEEEFRALTRRPTPAGGYGASWRSAFLYAAEPGASAYYDTLSNARRFLASRGEESSGSFSSARTDAMRQYKRAVRYEQPDVAEKYLRIYVARGGTARGFKQSLARMAPLNYVPKRLRDEFKGWLTPDEQAKLADAEKYYEEVFGPDSPGTDEAHDFINALVDEKESEE